MTVWNESASLSRARLDELYNLMEAHRYTVQQDPLLIPSASASVQEVETLMHAYPTNDSAWFLQNTQHTPVEWQTAAPIPKPARNLRSFRDFVLSGSV